MDSQLAINRGERDLMRVYDIFHKEDPERKVRFRTLRTLTAKEIKQKAVSAGLFKAEVIQELRVERQ